MAKINSEQLKQLIEAAIFVADEPLSIERMQHTILVEFSVSKKQINTVINDLKSDYAARGIQLRELASCNSYQSNDA